MQGTIFFYDPLSGLQSALESQFSFFLVESAGAAASQVGGAVFVAL
jgi:hypothetical protein